MKHIEIHQTATGWLYSVYLAGRLVVIGLASTKERAEVAAGVV